MSFDRLAPHYRWIEAVFAGERLQRCRTAMLAAIPPPKNVLIYGEGNGRFLVGLLRCFPGVRVTVVESSGVMIRLAQERLCRDGFVGAPVSFVEADALTWSPPEAAFDLIVTCFFLDCFREDQLRWLIPAIARAATLESRWLVSDFQIATRGYGRWRSRLIVGLLYTFFRLATQLPGRALIDPALLLNAAGFSCARHEELDHGMLYSSVWQRGENASQDRRTT